MVFLGSIYYYCYFLKKKSKERAKLEIKVDNIPQFVHNETITSACSVNSFLSVTETKPFRTKIVTQV